MTSLNVYTCTQAELETFHQIDATSSAKIVALRDAVIAGQRPEMTVADLAEIRLTEDQWQSSIDQGDLSLDFHATGHFTDISPSAKTNAEKFTFTSQSPLGKDTTQTIEHSLNMLTANMESLSAQMMYLGQTLSDRMGQLHNTVTGMQQDTDTLANSMHKIETQNKDMQKHLRSRQICGRRVENIEAYFHTTNNNTTTYQPQKGHHIRVTNTYFITYDHNTINFTTTTHGSATFGRGHVTLCSTASGSLANFCCSTTFNNFAHTFSIRCQAKDINMA